MDKDDAAEAYRVLRTNLLVAVHDVEQPTIMVTSSRAGEGKTSTVANLAPVMALAGRRVIVVDLDLRNPDLHNAFGVPNTRGAAEVLHGHHPLDDCVQYVQVNGPGAGTECGFYVLTAGVDIQDPAELIGSSRTLHLLEVLASQADVVLIDTPPVIGFADSLVLARLTTGVILVVEARATPLPMVQQAKDALIRSQARMLGVVVTKVDPRDASNVGYVEAGLGYSYAYTPERP